MRTDLELEVVLDDGERHVILGGEPRQLDEADLAEERVELGAHVLRHVDDRQARLIGWQRDRVAVGLMRANQWAAYIYMYNTNNMQLKYAFGTKSFV